LKQYRAGERTNAVMAGFAGQLSDDDIKVLAKFYASQKGLFTPDP
jgi:cytochrome c553